MGVFTVSDNRGGGAHSFVNLPCSWEGECIDVWGELSMTMHGVDTPKNNTPQKYHF